MAVPNKDIRYVWTARDQMIATSPPAQQPGKPPPTVTPYGINARESRPLDDVRTGKYRPMSQYVKGDAVKIPMIFSTAGVEHRARRFFVPEYEWEQLPTGSAIKGKTIGELCAALFASSPIRYHHLDPSRPDAADQAWRLFDFWENTDYRWSVVEGGRFAWNMNPLAIPTEAVDPRDGSTKHRLAWVLAKSPRRLAVAAAPGVQVVAAPPTWDRDSWAFELRKGRLVAVSVGQARYADLGDGSLGSGIAKPGTEVDITPLFPGWVAQVLMAQEKTGFMPVQPDPTQEPQDPWSHPTEYASRYEFGHGNCHGFTSKLFNLYDTEAMTYWEVDSGPSTVNKLTSRPADAPAKISDVDPRYQLIHVDEGKKGLDDPAKSGARLQRYRTVEGFRWTAFVYLGKNTFMKRIIAAGGHAVTSPRFGDPGLRKKGDHSLIALGLAGANKNWVYTLQKIALFQPYAVILKKVDEYDWFHVRDTLR